MNTEVEKQIEINKRNEHDHNEENDDNDTIIVNDDIDEVSFFEDVDNNHQHNVNQNTISPIKYDKAVDTLSILESKYNYSINDNKPEPLEFVKNINFHDDDDYYDNNSSSVQYIELTDGFFHNDEQQKGEKDDNTSKESAVQQQQDVEENNNIKVNNKILLKDLYNRIYYSTDDITQYIINEKSKDKEVLARYLQLQVSLRLKCQSQIGTFLPTPSTLTKKTKRSKRKKNTDLNEICKLLSLLPIHLLQPNTQLKDIFYTWLYKPFYDTLSRFIIKIYDNFELKLPIEEDVVEDNDDKKDIYLNNTLLIKKTKPTTEKLLRSISLPLPDTITIPTTEPKIEEPKLKRSTSLPCKKVKISNQKKKSNPFLNDSVTNKYVGNHFSSRRNSFVFHSAKKDTNQSKDVKIPNQKITLERRASQSSYTQLFSKSTPKVILKPKSQKRLLFSNVSNQQETKNLVAQAALAATRKNKK